MDGNERIEQANLTCDEKYLLYKTARKLHVESRRVIKVSFMLRVALIVVALIRFSTMDLICHGNNLGRRVTESTTKLNEINTSMRI